MIFENLLVFLYSTLFFIFDNFADVTELPLSIGPYLTEMMGYVYAFSIVFWPITPIIVCFLWWLPFKAMVMLLKFMLGSRIPSTL